ncbi:MAG: hypothetical protein AB7N76_31445 [Planctomycetota bacterium]
MAKQEQRSGAGLSAQQGALALGGLAVVLVVGAAWLVLRDPPAPARPSPRASADRSPAVAPRPSRSSAPPPASPTTSPGPRVTPSTAPTATPAPSPSPSPSPVDGQDGPRAASGLSGAELRRALEGILSAGERAERAEDQEGAMRAGQALMQTIAEVVGRGPEAALAEAKAWLAPGTSVPLQVSAVRLLDQLPGGAALERLADLTLEPGRDPAVRMHALRALRKRDAAFAQGAIAEAVADKQRDPAVRCFAMDQLSKDAIGSLEDVVTDREDAVEVRVHALEVLKRTELERFTRCFNAVRTEPALAEHLRRLRQ